LVPIAKMSSKSVLFLKCRECESRQICVESVSPKFVEFMDQGQFGLYLSEEPETQSVLI